MPTSLALGLKDRARSTIAGHGVGIREYLDYWGHGLDWHGDECGCPDDRCRGHHHAELDACGCLPACIATVLENRPASDSRKIASDRSEV